MCFIEPLDAKNDLDKNSPFYYHILTKVIKFYLNDLTHFDKTNPAYSFVANTTWKTFFKIRSFIQAYNIIELSSYREVNDPEGILITVSCRSQVHDLLLIYVPNIPLFGSEPYFYLEYLLTLHSLLLLQGFDSPAVFIMKFPEICKESPMEYSLKYFAETYTKLVRDNPNAKLILMGEAIGATLILNYLSAKNNVFHNDDIVNVMNQNPDHNSGPFGCILLSPIVKFNSNISVDIKTSDFFNHQCLSHASSMFCGNINLDKYNPASWASTEIWNKIVPKGGMVISYGDLELQSRDIENIFSIAAQSNMIKVMKGKHKGHCWQLMSFLTEETQDEKEDSCFILAGILSRMVLYQTDAYRNPNVSHEPMNLLTIDDDHL